MEIGVERGAERGVWKGKRIVKMKLKKQLFFESEGVLLMR